MAQKPIRGNAPVPKQPTAPQEEDAAEKSQEKPQDQGTIAVVKSKIREKDAAQHEEDPPASTKVTSSKLSAKYKKLKRGASAENMKEKAAAVKKSEIKPENVESIREEDQPKLETESKFETRRKSEDDQTKLAGSRSKKSAIKIIPSKNYLTDKKDDQTENIPAVKSEIRKESAMSADSATTGQSQENTSETQDIKNMQSDLNSARKISPKPLSQRPAPERKNYLANLYPEPLDEYSGDEEEPKNQEEQNTKPE